jgi:hypothetical protein
LLVAGVISKQDPFKVTDDDLVETGETLEVSVEIARPVVQQVLDVRDDQIG